MNETNVPERAPRSLEELGAVLRQTRESRELSLDDIAAETCIRKNFLEDIEAGRFENFKALVYARGFVRTYTTLLEVPELWEEYSGCLTSAAVRPTVPPSAPAKPERPARVADQPPSAARAGASAAAQARCFRPSSARRYCIAVLLLVAVAVAGALAVNWDSIRGEIGRVQAEQAETALKKRAAEQAELAAQRKAEEEAIELARQQQQAAEQPKPAQQQPPAQPQQESQQPQTSEQTPEPTPPAQPKAALTIRATSKCWIRVRSGGKTVFMDTVTRGWEQTFALDETLDVVYGLGQNVTFSTDGKDFARAGKGREHYEYRPDGTSVRHEK